MEEKFYVVATCKNDCEGVDWYRDVEVATNAVREYEKQGYSVQVFHGVKISL
jgi:hypothetical protein